MQRFNKIECARSCCGSATKTSFPSDAITSYSIFWDVEVDIETKVVHKKQKSTKQITLNL